MLSLITFLVSVVAAIFGFMKARKQGGDRADQIQWAFSFGLIAFIFSILTLAIIAFIF